jgi:hypothetical protein
MDQAGDVALGELPIEAEAARRHGLARGPSMAVRSTAGHFERWGVAVRSGEGWIVAILVPGRDVPEASALVQ